MKAREPAPIIARCSGCGTTFTSRYAIKNHWCTAEQTPTGGVRTGRWPPTEETHK